MRLYNQLKKVFATLTSALGYLAAVFLSHMYPPKHPPHRSLLHQGLDSLQLELPLLRQGLHVTSLGNIQRLARAGTPCLRFGCIPGLSAHTQIWENNPPGRGGGRWGSSALAGAPLRPPFSILASMHGGSAGLHRDGRGKWVVAGRAPA